MTVVERLHIIRAHLRTGAVGQREVWEEWLTEAAAEIELLTALLREAVLYDSQIIHIESWWRKVRRELERKP